MSKGKQKEPVAVVEKSAPASISVPGKSWDPADPVANNNEDAPIYVPPVAVPHKINPFAGTHGAIHEGAGESRPMFSSSLKES